MFWFKKQETSLSPRLAALSKVPLFETLSPSELKAISQIFHERSYLPGEVIFDEGDEGLGMYIILEGSVKICQVEGPEHKQKRHLVTLPTGSYFGELALLDGAPRSASAISETHTQLLGFFRPEFMDILESHGRLGTKLSLQLARRTAQRLRKSVPREDAEADYR